MQSSYFSAAGAILGIIVAAAAVRWSVTLDDVQVSDPVMIFHRSASDIRLELRKKGFALTKVSDVIQALENIHLVMPLNGDGYGLEEPFYYSGGYFSRRTVGSTGFVYDVGPSNPNLTLVPHNEMGYGPRTPRYIAFGAKLAATGGGGDTMLLDGHQVFARLEKKWQDMLQRRKIRYRVRFDGNDEENNSTTLKSLKKHQTSWHQSFASTNPQDATLAALALGYHQARIMNDVFHSGEDCESPEMETGSQNHKSIQTIYDAWAVVRHPLTGQPCMFEQIVGAHGSALDKEEHESKLPFRNRLHHTTWAPSILQQDDTNIDDSFAGQGEDELESEFLEQLDQLASDLLVRVAIPTGHVLVVDNIWHKHGRSNFQGEREMLVAMRGSYRGTASGLFEKDSSLDF